MAFFYSTRKSTEQISECKDSVFMAYTTYKVERTEENKVGQVMWDQWNGIEHPHNIHLYVYKWSLIRVPSIHGGERKVSSTNGVGQLGNHIWKNEINPILRNI